ncbi:hypothetical protein [Kribbella sp. CA-293567]|uniref:hypothetical protein n=1 Tax=Kribbella sp. CA-293567 TaxID=3002436 RepID=UPI0022DE9245|nr:hypothetical protein [Kribbella sp. CA-293567]WBQ07851.1 hypothetical protein OX958_13870 [Kribbella sp. CA-293567]
MSEEYSVFLRTGQSVAEVAAWLKELLGLRPVADASGRDDEVGLRGAAVTVEGTLGFLVHRNWHVLVDPEPGEVQAIDAYPVQVDVWYGDDEGVQEREARLVFEKLTGAGVAMLLVRDVTDLVAAYLPEAGMHDFPAGVSMDEPDLEQWRDWVVGVA